MSQKHLLWQEARGQQKMQMSFFWSKAILRIPTASFAVSPVAHQRVREWEELVIVIFKGPQPESLEKPVL